MGTVAFLARDAGLECLGETSFRLFQIIQLIVKIIVISKNIVISGSFNPFIAWACIVEHVITLILEQINKHKRNF